MNSTEDSYEKAIDRESIFRSLATVMNDYDGPSSVIAYDSDDMPEFIPELGSIDVTDIADDLPRHTFSRNKLAAILRATTELVTDSGFDMDGYLVKRLSRAFAKAEDMAFVTGTGEDEPTGILDDTAGAETGVTASSLTFDDVISLNFSGSKDYRKNGVWLMNDKTAYTLRTLKANCGMNLWDHANDTILGKKVIISDDMPDADSGEKPIAFTERYDKAQKRCEALKRRKVTLLFEVDMVECFMTEIRLMPELPITFDERHWNKLIDHVTVFSDDRLLFTFKTGGEITKRL